MRPKQVGAAARRIAAKMVADQAVPLMISMVGFRGELEVIHEDFALVLVARGEGAARVIDWIESTCGPVLQSVEIEPATPEDGP